MSVDNYEVVQVATVDRLGGAAKASYLQNAGLCNIGIDSKLYVAVKTGTDENVIQYIPANDYRSRVSRRVKYEILKYKYLNGTRLRDANRWEKFSSADIHYGYDAIRNIPSSDVVNLHWISEFIDLRKIFSAIRNSKPIVWTMHDMFPFTGGCHYAKDCTKYRNSCGDCPQLNSGEYEDYSSINFKKKYSALSSVRNENLVFVGNSEWTANEARSSKLCARFDVRTIHYGIDTSIFKKLDQKTLREKYSVPQDHTILVFSASGLGSVRKGFKQLVESISHLLAKENVLLVSIGKGESSRLDADIAVKHIRFGHIDNDYMMAEILNLGDIYIMASLEEASGLTAIEAASCGLPVVAFDVGGVRDTVVQNNTGFLVRKGSSIEMAKAIDFLINDKALRQKYGSAGELHIRNTYSMKINAEKYNQLYEELLERKYASQS